MIENTFEFVGRYVIKPFIRCVRYFLVEIIIEAVIEVVISGIRRLYNKIRNKWKNWRGR